MEIFYQQKNSSFESRIIWPFEMFKWFQWNILSQNTNNKVLMKSYRKNFNRGLQLFLVRRRTSWLMILEEKLHTRKNKYNIDYCIQCTWFPNWMFQFQLVWFTYKHAQECKLSGFDLLFCLWTFHTEFRVCLIKKCHCVLERIRYCEEEHAFHVELK